MQPLYKSLYLIVAPADIRRGLEPGYYAPVSVEDYEAGVILPDLKPAPGWSVIVTDEYNYPLYSSKVNKALRKGQLDIRRGNGLQAYQQAAIEAIIDEDTRRVCQNIYSYAHQRNFHQFRQEAAINSPLWMRLDRIEKMGWIDGTQGDLRGGFVRRVYDITRLGFEVIKIMAAVYGW